jgi:hypothetical protein
MSIRTYKITSEIQEFKEAVISANKREMTIFYADQEEKNPPTEKIRIVVDGDEVGFESFEISNTNTLTILVNFEGNSKETFKECTFLDMILGSQNPNNPSDGRSYEEKIDDIVQSEEFKRMLAGLDVDKLEGLDGKEEC